MRGLLPLLLGCGLLAACAVGPDYAQPEVDLPEEWPEELDARMEADFEDIDHWWELYEEPVLEQLVREALVNNLDVAVAAARVTQARAVLGLSRSERYPTLDAFAEAEREDPGLTGGETGSEFVLGGLLSYELDLWGRLARSEEAARAELLNTAFSRDAVVLAVIGDVVGAYFAYRATIEQIEITQATIQSLQEALELERSRREGGASTELAVRQAEAELETSRAGLPSLHESAERQRRALAVLIGDQEAVLEGVDFLDEHGLDDLADTQIDLPDTMPSELLLRRPDIRAAEASLIAANADIGATRAAWLPSLNLAALFGQGATQFGDLASSDAGLWEISAAATVPILSFGRRQAELDAAEAGRDIAEQQYRAAIQAGFQEVGDAWTVLRAAEERVAAREREIEARVEVLRLAERRYLGGYIPYLEVLDARRALLDARLTMTEASRDRLVATAVLFRALGGLHGVGDAIPGPRNELTDPGDT